MIRAFAIYMGIALILVAAAVIYLVRHNVEANARQRALDQTSLASTMIVPKLVPTTAWDRPLGGELLAKAYTIAGANLVSNEGLAVSLYGPTGRLLFSTIPNATDARGATADRVRRAMAGEKVSAITELKGERPEQKYKSIESFASVTYPGESKPAGVLTGYRSYNTVTNAFKKQVVPLAIAVLLVFLLLYLALLPVLKRTTRALAHKNIELQRQADDLNENLHARTAIEQRLRETIAELERSENALTHSQTETIMRLSMAVETRDQDTGDHIERMGRYCQLLAKKTGWSEEKSELLRIAAPLHDVGKIAVPDAILLKPGKLTEEERREIERHAEIGHEILAGSDSPLLDLAARIALSHHEHWDGAGYPNGLSGTDIPVEGRMAAIADVFDALTSDRVYRPAMTVDRALSIMSEGRGGQFDPELLDVFFDSIVEVMMIRDGNSEPTAAEDREDLPQRRVRQGKQRSVRLTSAPEGDVGEPRSMVG